MRDDVLVRLRLDPGQRTIGQLLQDREAAFHEIVRLRACIERLRGADTARPTKTEVIVRFAGALMIERVR